jgi:hypothetical protein
LFRSLSGFWEREIAIHICSTRSQNSYRFLSRSFRSSKLDFGIPSEKFVTENLKEISKTVQLLVTKRLDLPNSFFYGDDFHSGSKTRWDKKN